MADQVDIYCPWSGWSLVRLLGQGTFGRVYLFKREEYGNTYFCAVKHVSIPTYSNQADDLFAEGLATDSVSLQAYLTQLLESFMNEVNINVELRGHTNFVSYDDHQIIPRKDRPGYDIYIKMEYLTNLNTYLRQHPLTLADALRLGEDICSAMSVLQKRNLIHRDIKPENIFINKAGNFKLGDFGIARSLDEAVIRMSARGTRTFMAPEMAYNEKSDYRVDLYSLGLVLYRLLNGNRAPFLPPLPAPVTRYEYNAAQDMRISGASLPPPVYADNSLSDIILKACAFDLDKRWRDADQMKDKLLEYGYTLNDWERQSVILDINVVAKESDLPELSATDTRDTYTGDKIVIPDIDQDADSNDVKQQLAPLLWQIVRSNFRLILTFFAACVAVAILIILFRSPIMKNIFDKNPPLNKGSPIASEIQNNQEITPSPSTISPTLVQSPPSSPAQEPTPSSTPSPSPTSEPTLSLAPSPTPSPSPSPAPSLSPTTTPSPSPSDTLAPSQASTETPSDSMPVVFNDAVVESAVRLQLGKDTGDILSADLRRVSQLTIESGSIKSVRDLSALTNLKTLIIKNQQLSDTSLLGQLSNLDRLTVSGCRLADASFIGRLTKLTFLDISNNKITSLSFASKLLHLVELNISDTDISDLMPLSDLAQLKILTARNTKVRYWTPVDHLDVVDDGSSPLRDPTPTPASGKAPTPTPTKAPTPTPTKAPTPTPTKAPTPSPTKAPTPTPTRAPTPTPTKAPTPTPTKAPTPTSTPAPTSTPTPAPTPPGGITGVSLSPSSLVLEIGQGASLTASVTPSSEQSNASFSWKSSNSSVASVSGGRVTAIGSGTATITVSCNGFSASCKVTVS